MPPGGLRPTMPPVVLLCGGPGVVRHHGRMSSELSSYVPNELLGRLVGARLYSVQFVHDYVQLWFEGPGDDMPVMNCDAIPAIEAGGLTLSDGEVGYADALRGLIPQIVQRTQEGTGMGLRIEFPDGAVVLHPDREALKGPEIALLSGFEDRAWMCWRTGEESFEDLT